MKKITILATLVLALFLTACGPSEVTTTSGAFLGGNEGVIVSFEPLSVEEGGVYSIFDSEDFPIEIVVNNKGENDLESGKASFRLLGPAKADFSNIPNWELKNIELIDKKSEFNPEGGEEIISFTPNSYATYTNEVIGYTDITWNLEYWYDYTTHLIINDVCFKGDPTDTKVCDVKETKTYSVSGAPITITSVEEDTGGKGIVLLKINVRNTQAGQSTVINSGFDDRFDQISYTIDEPGKWECKSGGREGEARLIDGVAQIICRLKSPLEEDEIYQRTVKLDLEYTYKDLIQEKLRIKESIK